MSANENISTSIQESLITMLACGTAANVTRLIGMIGAKDFDAGYADIASRCIAYFQEYGRTAGLAHIDDLLPEAGNPASENGARMRAILSEVVATAPNINEDFLLSKVSSFRRRQEMKRFVLAAAMRLQNGDADGTEA